jgi:NAD(P)-dependent dehydrogenase (short-subunit alcohol dehydrogenase family)
MRSVILTGASRGLGAAIAARLCERGDRLLLLARSFPDEQRELARQRPDAVVLRECDLAGRAVVPSSAELAGFLGEAAEPVLVNNAATGDPLGAIGALDPVELASAVSLNLLAPMALTNAFLSAICPSPGGGPMRLHPHVKTARIVFVTSSTARRPKPGSAAYCATKAGAEMFFDVLRGELGDAPVEVYTVDPGGMDTRMHAHIRGLEGVYLPDQDRLREVAAAGALRAPDEVARRILTETGLALD